MKQKVLFFDIDGTLIWSYGGIQEIPQGVQKELKRLKEQGHKLFICSGRPKAMLDQKWWDGTFDGYVLNNGGYVEIDGKSIYENRMDYELCLKTANMLEELHCDYMIATANHLYIDPSYKELYNFFVQNGHFKDLFTTKFDRNEVLKRAIKIEANVTNKDREKIENYIQNDFGYVINFDEHGSDNAFEFYSPTISKATGIQKVLDYYHLDQDDTYAFGDGENDLEMIDFCRVGVAMGNACDVLKEKANTIQKVTVMIAFIGSLFVIKPSIHFVSNINSFIGVLGAMGAGIAYTCVRKLGQQGVAGAKIVFFFSLFSCLSVVPYLILHFQPMTLQQIGCLLMAGLMATGGQFSITNAYTYAPAKEISIYDYTQVIFAALLGFFLLNQVPDVYSVIGYIIIIGVAFWNFMKQKRCV